MPGLTRSEKIISAHLKEGQMEEGREIGLTMDQTLTQDATGTMAFLQFEAIGAPRVRTELSVSYVDHNTLQEGFENFDDHLYLQSAAAKFGVQFSRAGNGICHQVHLERFAAPGKTLLGSDSHTPTAGGIGSLAIGAGGLNVAVAMGGGLFYFKMPKIVGVKLSGRLPPWTAAKDVILELLRRLTVKGGVGKIIEYCGDGVKALSVPERATIANMGAELGATTSVFPSDEVTRDFLRRQKREKDFKPLAADSDAKYSEVIEVDLSKIEPMIAKPHSPDAVVPVSEVAGTPVHQVIVGSCTNSSYRDLMTAALMLKGRKVSPDVSFVVAPGSRQVLRQIADSGGLAMLISAGARIVESACGPCIGMGQAPPSGGISIRTFNRNFEGRSGTKDAKVYLVSPEVAMASAIKGVITDPRSLGNPPPFEWPSEFAVDDSMIIAPPADGSKVEIRRGPNIKSLPEFKPMPQALAGEVLIKLGDNVTTDHIMPAGAKILPLRSNIPAISEYVFSGVDAGFVKRAKGKGGGFIVGGENYGQGSSREHAALAPMYLGVKAVLAKSFARIHAENLVNFGILPLTFADAKDYDAVKLGDRIEMEAGAALEQGKTEIPVKVDGKTVVCKHSLSPRFTKVILAGGLLNYTRKSS
ncbi:MAG: aconitate hydratase [Candidatus Micrarchaeota archaeon]